jgi:hypothetical protein
VLGVNVTLIVHVFPRASEEPQLFVSRKLPFTVTLAMDSVVVRLLVSVAKIGLLVVPTVWLGNVSVPGERLTAAMPVPLVLIAWGLLLALSVIVTTLAADPVVVGLKVTEIVHFLCGNTVFPQVLVWANGAVAVMLLIDSVALPVFVRVTFLVTLVVPVITLPKLRLVGESETVCAVPAAVSNKNASPGSKNSARKLPGNALRAGLPPRRTAKIISRLH